ncbi:prolyl 3-hydroxylase OGFOD1 isoform X1 [Rhizophagus clarus]|uniref:Prolyl 3-hydroxylase OGFOD1 isoform X1 n=1 Tax=Rhizophagus clarus TaxID=94130 RepID=A0A8H3L6B5_9GLOM|nr:prolyl 3-hydroxylase OGFOD1 isoform X1 [Rhizophagus clarus]
MSASSASKRHTSQDLVKDDDLTPVPSKKQKLDTSPADNDSSELNTILSKLEDLAETAEITEENVEEVPDILNKNYIDPNFITRFYFSFRKNQLFTDETSQAVIYDSPFTIAHLPNIFDNEFLSKVKDEVKELDFDVKSSDLYEFHQSLDLKICEKPNLSKLRDTVYSSSFVRTISNLVGFDLDCTPDLSVQKYEKGSYLLCHDDDIKDDDFINGRIIAFIIYLVDENWSKEDGGALEFFNTDSQGHPDEITLSITPKWNTMIFFALSPTSFHQVSEINSSSKNRYSISGWFHGPLNTRLSRAYFAAPISEDFDLGDFLNPVYLNEKNKQRILEKLQKDSYILLSEFLRDDVFNRLMASIKETGWEEKSIGPPFIRKYYLLKDSEISDFNGYNNNNIKDYKNSSSSFCKYVYEFFKSRSFSTYIKEISNWQTTGVASEFRQFRSGSYTVIHDQAQDRIGADVTLFCIESGWNEKWGGGTSYVANEHELLVIYPKKNTLSIAIREAGTLKFVKYVNSRAAFPRTEMSFIYWDDDYNGGEEEEDEENEEVEENEGEVEENKEGVEENEEGVEENEEGVEENEEGVEENEEGVEENEEGVEENEEGVEENEEGVEENEEEVEKNEERVEENKEGVEENEGVKKIEEN